MTRRVALALASLLLAFAAGRVSATPRSAPVIPAGPVGVSEPDRGQSEAPRTSPAVSPAPVAVPVPPRSQPTNAPAANVAPGRSVSGVASWYCLEGRSACTAGYGPDCACAAAGARLRAALGPGWRGAWVTVAAGERSVRVALVDTMANPDGWWTCTPRSSPASRP